MKTKSRNTKNLVAKHAYKYNKSRVQENELKEKAKRACRGHQPSSLYWLI